ncbi:hypothetical protein TNCV_1967471 [Trichonephila clavipes]|nr:hypothetical protein TNCV_1967471 [Trichonephila clavipes]
MQKEKKISSIYLSLKTSPFPVPRDLSTYKCILPPSLHGSVNLRERSLSSNVRILSFSTPKKQMPRRVQNAALRSIFKVYLSNRLNFLHRFPRYGHIIHELFKPPFSTGRERSKMEQRPGGVE